jgi:hypothetical protein
MGFRRAIAPSRILNGDELTAALVGIGISLAAAPARNPNIEDVLLAASVEGLEHDDLRVLAMLVTWLGVHSAWINADRLTSIVRDHPSERVRAFWSAIARGLAKDRRFARMAKAYPGPRIDLLGTGTDFQIKRAGEDPRFAGTPLRVPANVLRDRKGDVLSPAELARRHRSYRMRVMLGPSYRADIWAELEGDSSLPPAELARRTYGSFATAWRIKHDWALLHGGTVARHEASPAG